MKAYVMLKEVSGSYTQWYTCPNCGVCYVHKDRELRIRQLSEVREEFCEDLSGKLVFPLSEVRTITVWTCKDCHRNFDMDENPLQLNNFWVCGACSGSHRTEHEAVACCSGGCSKGEGS